MEELAEVWWEGHQRAEGDLGFKRMKFGLMIIMSVACLTWSRLPSRNVVDANYEVVVDIIA